MKRHRLISILKDASRLRFHREVAKIYKNQSWSLSLASHTLLQIIIELVFVKNPQLNPPNMSYSRCDINDNANRVVAPGELTFYGDRLPSDQFAGQSFLKAIESQF